MGFFRDLFLFREITVSDGGPDLEEGKGNVERGRKQHQIGGRKRIGKGKGKVSPAGLEGREEGEIHRGGGGTGGKRSTHEETLARA